MLIGISILGLLIGVSLAIFGWYGRLVSKGPSCRRCGYALGGISHVTRCPECGAEFIGAKRPYVSEVRRMRKIPIGIGAVLALASGAVLAFALLQSMS